MKRGIGRAALAIAGTWLFVGASTAAAGDGIVTTQLEPDRQAVLDFWTPERMREAIEAPADRKASAAVTPPDVEVPAGFETLYPYRVHGRMFGAVGGGTISCSATIVTSATLNLVTTAAHCLRDPDTGAITSNIVFVPAYRDNARPFGTWVVSSFGYPAEWNTAYDGADFGVLSLLPNASGVQIQSLLGSRGISFNRPIRQFVGQSVSILGYPAKPQPSYNGQRLIECNVPITAYANESGLIAEPCNQQQGSSGGGWIQNGIEVGVTAQGGCGPATAGCTKIAATYLGAAALNLYRSAGGQVPTIPRKRLKKCKKIRKPKKRQRCRNPVQTVQPTGA